MVAIGDDPSLEGEAGFSTRDKKKHGRIIDSLHELLGS